MKLVGLGVTGTLQYPPVWFAYIQSSIFMIVHTSFRFIYYRGRYVSSELMNEILISFWRRLYVNVKLCRCFSLVLKIEVCVKFKFLCVMWAKNEVIVLYVNFSSYIGLLLRKLVIFMQSEVKFA